MAETITLDFTKQRERNKALAAQQPQQNMPLSQNAGSPQMAQVAQDRVNQGSTQFPNAYNAGNYGNFQTREYEPAKFNGGYYSGMANTALQNVMGRNIMKSDMERNKIIAGLAQQKMSNDNNYAIQKMDAQNKLDIQNRANENAINVANINAGADIYKTETQKAYNEGLLKQNNNGYDGMKSRLEIANSDAFTGFFPPDVAKALSSNTEQLNRAKMQYIQTGTVPQLSYDDGGWFGGGKFTEAGIPQQQGWGQQYSNNLSQPKVRSHADLSQTQTNSLMADIADNMGVSLSDMQVDQNSGSIVIKKTGQRIPITKAWERFNGSGN